MELNPNVIYQKTAVSQADREILNGHKSAMLWFTGLSGSGKSTLSQALDKELYTRNVHSYVLDGDNIRHGLNRDLGFTEQDRTENIRRIAELGGLFTDAGLIVSAAFISPYREDRRKAREIIRNAHFIEIYVKCTVEICETRDVKGLYKKARNGEIQNFTGINAPYEEPLDPEIIIETDKYTEADSLVKILTYLETEGIIPTRKKNG
jgi:adenylylsulfate kinase